MKKLLFTLTLLITVSSFGQSKNDSLISNEKVVFIKKNSRHLINKNSKLLVLENKDTLILAKRYIPKFVYPTLPTKKETRYFKTMYPYIAFGSYTKYESKKNEPLRQWNVPIKVFIDKSFRESDRIKIKKYIVSLSNLEIPNLKISIVRNKSDSNYHITTTNKKIEILNEKKLEQYSDEQVENRFKDNANYYISSDNNYKSSSCILKVNLDTFEEKNDVIKKIKQLFFGSFGRFYPLTYRPKESLLYTKYVNNDTISAFDINVLKTHYNYIYPYKVDFNLLSYTLRRHNLLLIFSQL
ncbi:MAG: DUF2927 domain-containing protein [Flavobacteriaceae bacterium]|nr:DUF2927 domain-containing protein [Flavobacteriaceae bacterium]